MPAISAVSSKGGCGKSTVLSALICALQMSPKVNAINVIDCDEKPDLSDWLETIEPEERKKIKIFRAHTPESLIDTYAKLPTNQITLIDLEGSANELITTAINISNLVLIPLKASANDAKQAFRTLKNIRHQEKAAKLTHGVEKSINRAFVLTGVNAAVKTKAQASIEADIEDAGEAKIPVPLIQRNPYESIVGYCSFLHNLPKEAATEEQRKKAIANAQELLKAVLSQLQEGSSKEVA